MDFNNLSKETIAFIRERERELAVMMEPYQDLEDVDIASWLINTIDSMIKQGLELNLETIKKNLIEKTPRNDSKQKNNIREEVKYENLSNEALYNKDVETTIRLTKEEEYEYLLRAKQGDLYARKKLIESNLRLVRPIARKYIGQGLSYLELVQEGNIGLIKAIDKYDISTKNRISTYATPAIHREIQSAIANQAQMIRIPKYRIEDINKLKFERTRLIQELNRESTDEELAEKLNIDMEQLDKINNSIATIISLDTTIEENEDTCLVDFINDEKIITPEKYIINVGLREQLFELLEILTEKEKQIIILRYGLDNGQYKTLQEVGNIMGTRKQNISRIEKRALTKLEKSYRREKLRDYLN